MSERKLKKLIAEWWKRAAAARMYVEDIPNTRAATYEQCAMELEKLLAAENEKRTTNHLAEQP